MFKCLASAVLAFASLPAAASSYTSPAEIDHALASFTGAMTGSPGGARMPTDPRLRLAACAAPLALDWHTPSRTSVRVECPGPVAWRIFVAVAPPAGASSTGTGIGTGAGTGAQAIKRGDNVMIAVRGRGFSVQQPGEAIEGGAVGDWIFVRTARKSEALRARIERPGLVVIPAS